MDHHLTLQTAPGTEPVTLAELKDHLDYTAADRDDYLTSLIRTARRYCENRTSRSLFTQTWQLALDRFPGSLGTVLLSRGPVQSITSVAYTDTNGDAQIVDADDYQLDNNREPARLAPARASRWPSTDSDTLAAIKITYVTGWADAADIPTDYKHAIKLLAAHFFENPSAVTTEGTPKVVPLTVRMLLDLNDYSVI